MSCCSHAESDFHVASQPSKGTVIQGSESPDYEDYLALNPEFTLHQRPLSQQITQMRSEFNALERSQMERVQPPGGAAPASTDRVTFKTSKRMMPFNRYCNIAANDETIFPPLTSPESNDPFLYINGNKMELNVNRSFVASQAPVPAGIPQFYATLIRYNITLVLMLTREIENGILKANRYWPKASTTSSKRERAGAYSVWADASSYASDDKLQIIYRTFCIQEIQPEGATKPKTTTTTTTTDADQAHRVTVIQYTGWPDHGVPTSMDSFNSLVNSIIKYDGDAPILVHCSAGVGRTATLIGCYAGMYQIQRGLLTNHSIRSLVNEMRMARFGSVQRLEQYMFIYVFLMHSMGIKIDALLDEVMRMSENVQ